MQQLLSESNPDQRVNAHNMIYDYAKLYSAAKDKKEQEKAIGNLRKFLEKFSSINSFRHLESPVMRLAKEGNKEAVWLLLNYFMADLDHAAEGLATKGDFEFTRMLIDLGANLGAVLRGLSAGGHFQFLTEFSLLGSDRDSADAYGLALGNHKERLQQLLSSFQDVREKIYNFSLAVRAAAAAGNKELLDELLKDEASFPKKIFHNNVSLALYDAVACDQRQVADDLLKRLAIPQDSFRTLMGSALNGDEESIKKYLREHFQNVEYTKFATCLQTFAARGGHFHIIDLLEKYKSITNNRSEDEWQEAYIFVPMAASCHLDLVTHLKRLQLREYSRLEISPDFKFFENFFKTQYADCSPIIKANAQHFNCPERLLRYLVSINCKEIREKIVAEYNSNFTPAIDANSFLLKANRIESLMKKYKVGYWEAKAWTKSLDEWFLQGIQLVQQQKIHLDVFLRITSIFLYATRLHFF